ncbi:hypothetical protein [Marinomonas ostreistagni]|uniref:hypothetical protein n=1 Tax=Marinomonas ostreistagni TaxID=359209 RepID=UPI0019506A3B|nr:hypothetical protein [Marinomonas ostreistagni]MBM6550439.1 hypothetical protein [Marinomonas ostreistagni]
MTNTNEETPVAKDFFARPVEEQNDFLSQTWCNQCQEMDLGMKNPKEFETSSRFWIEGECVKCGSPVVTEIQYEDEE